jgi:hypothetical protein
VGWCFGNADTGRRLLQQPHSIENARSRKTTALQAMSVKWSETHWGMRLTMVCSFWRCRPPGTIQMSCGGYVLTELHTPCWAVCQRMVPGDTGTSTCAQSKPARQGHEPHMGLLPAAAHRAPPAHPTWPPDHATQRSFTRWPLWSTMYRPAVLSGSAGAPEAGAGASAPLSVRPPVCAPNLRAATGAAATAPLALRPASRELPPCSRVLRGGAAAPWSALLPKALLLTLRAAPWPLSPAAVLATRSPHSRPSASRCRAGAGVAAMRRAGG